MESLIDIEEIQEQLQDFSVSASMDVLSKMKELAVQYYDTESIVDKWIAYSATKKIDLNPSIKMLEQMEKEVLMKLKPTKVRKSRSSVTAPIFNSSTIDDIDILDPVVPDIAKTTKASLTFSPASYSPANFTPSMKYASRIGSGDIVCSFGNFKEVKWVHESEFSCSVQPYDEKTQIKAVYNYMSEKLRDLASILNDMIQEAAHVHQEKLDIEDWGHIQLPSMENIPVVGRICADGTGKLSSSSIFLEGSQEISSGQIIPLDVSQLEQFSFFPGQIIAGMASNCTGKKLVLSKLFEGILPPFCDIAPDLPNCYDELSVVVAAGPFSTSDSLSFEPLQDLMKYIKTHKPHILVLIGPFLDTKNQLVENDEVTQPFDEIFEQLVNEILGHIDMLSTKVVILPSSRDVHHHYVYPTPPVKSVHSKRLYLASDPCILNIENVLFGLTATDILFHLGKEEISHPQLPDRLGRLCSHLLSQRNFYPLYPPNEEVNVDYHHFELSAGIPVMPHIMILPSDLRHFIKDVNGCCCINPERLAKRATGGTFCRIKVKRVEKETYSGSIADSIQVEVVKI